MLLYSCEINSSETVIYVARMILQTRIACGNYLENKSTSSGGARGGTPLYSPTLKMASVIPLKNTHPRIYRIFLNKHFLQHLKRLEMSKPINW